MAAIDIFKQEAKKNLSFAYGGFGGLGLLFAASDIKGIAESDNKFKALLKTMKDFIFIRASMTLVFREMQAGIRALAKDTGSLDAALRRMASTQAFTRAFTPFVGGVRAARQHVADLLLFSQRTPFKFENIAEAERSLQGLTRGAFTGTGALTTIGDAAAKSGNGIVESAQAVGNFYATLREGAPIGRAVDQLRQMGLVTDIAATHLERLAESGASSTEMANNLTRALNEARGGMAGYAGDLEAITAAHDKAVEQAKAGFGADFAKPNIESIKNYTAAAVAIAPALEVSGRGLAAISKGFGDVTSKIAKVAAESKLLQGVLKALPAAVLVLGTSLFAVGIPGVIGLATAAAALNPVLGAVVATIGALVLAFAGGGLIKAWKDFAHSMSEAGRLEAMVKGHREAQAAIDAHAASIETLSDLHEQYGRVISHIIDLQNQLNNAQKEGNVKQIAEITRAMTEAREKLARLGPLANVLASPERMNVMQQRIQRFFEDQRARFEEGLRMHPGEAPERLRARAAVLREQAETGERGLLARQRRAEAEAGAGLAVAQSIQRQAEAAEPEAPFRLPTGEVKPAKQAARDAELAVARIESGVNQFTETQLRGTAVAYESEVRRLQAATQVQVIEKELQGPITNKQRKELEQAKKVQQTLAGGAVAGPGTAQQIQNLQTLAQHYAKLESDANINHLEDRAKTEDAIEAERGRKITEIGFSAAQQEAHLRLQGATMEAQKFGDIGKFITKFEQYRQQFDDNTAKRMAVAETQTEIEAKAAHDLIEAQRPVADSLTRIGGGGGFGGPMGDPRLMIQKRMENLQQNANQILSQIEENTRISGTAEPGGGAPEERPIAPEVAPLPAVVPAAAAPFTQPTAPGGAPVGLLAPGTPGGPPLPTVGTDVMARQKQRPIVPVLPAAWNWIKGLFGGGGMSLAAPAAPPGTAVPTAAPTPIPTPIPGVPPQAAVQRLIESMPQRALLAGGVTAAAIEAAAGPMPGPAPTPTETPAPIPIRGAAPIAAAIHAAGPALPPVGVAAAIAPGTGYKLTPEGGYVPTEKTTPEQVAAMYEAQPGEPSEAEKIKAWHGHMEDFRRTQAEEREAHAYDMDQFKQEQAQKSTAAHLRTMETIEAMGGGPPGGEQIQNQILSTLQGIHLSSQKSNEHLEIVSTNSEHAQQAF